MQRHIEGSIKLADSSSSSAITDQLPISLPTITHPIPPPVLPTIPAPPAPVSVPKVVAKPPPKPPTPRAAPKPPPLNPRDLYNLQWSEYSTKFSGSFQTLWEAQDLVDVTLAVDGQYIQAHKLVLSVCSDYFRDLFRINPCQHPIVILRDMDYECMSALVHFMYCGEVQVTAEKLPNLLRIAQQLKVNGLNSEGDKQQQQQETTPTHRTPVPDTNAPRGTPRIAKISSQSKSVPLTTASPSPKASGSSSSTTTGNKRKRFSIPSQVKVKVVRRNTLESDEAQAGTSSGDNKTFQQTNHNYINLPGTSKQDYTFYDHPETDSYNPNEHGTTNILETDLVEMIPIKLENEMQDTEPELHEFEYVSDVKEELGYSDEFHYETIEESESDHEGETEDVDLRF